MHLAFVEKWPGGNLRARSWQKLTGAVNFPDIPRVRVLFAIGSIQMAMLCTAEADGKLFDVLLASSITFTFATDDRPDVRGTDKNYTDNTRD